MPLILLLIFAFIFSTPSWATTVTFQEGVSSYAGTKDAIIWPGSTNQHTTNAAQIRAFDLIVYILTFDTSSISSTADVISATVTLTVSEQNCTTETARVRAIENPDNTGSFDANTAEADTFNDYATWAYKDHGSTIDWDSGASNAFTDVDDNADEDTESIAACSGFVTEDWVVTAMVQGWVTTPNSNAGMVFSLADTGRVDVRSRFYVTTTDRPLLTVEYTDGGAVAAAAPNHLLKNITIQGNLFISR